MTASPSGVRAAAMASTLAGILALGANPVGAAVINGGFGTGDFTGWTQIFAGGSQDVVESFDGFAGTTYSPIGGSYFAVLGGGDENEIVSIEQNLALGIGDMLSGWAFFSSDEVIALPPADQLNDFASVEVFDSSGARVARPFYLDTVTIGGVEDGPWTFWSFTATTADTYTLRLGVANDFDADFPSKAGFDGIRLQRVPEPSSLLALFLGLLASGARRRRAQG